MFFFFTLVLIVSNFIVVAYVRLSRVIKIILTYLYSYKTGQWFALKSK